MSGRVLVYLVALLGSLSLALPAAWAVPDFGSASIAPVVFATSPGATCTAQPANSVTLPPADGSGTISYAIAGLPDEMDLTGNTLTGPAADIKAQTATSYTYTATDSQDSQTASLTFTLEVVDERAVLEAFYTATNGDTWTSQTDADATNDWPNKGADPYTIPATTCLDDLHGVTVRTSGDNRGRISQLWLPANNLTGTIPDLSKLTALTGINLYGNQLSGRIPTKRADPNDRSSRVVALPAGLRELELNTNQLSGPIPPELGDLTALTFLDLEGNQLDGRIPSELGNLTSLTRLLLNDNQLSGPIPPELGDLTALTRLDLSTNQLDGRIPSELGALISLLDLQLDTNKLSGPIPPELGSLTSLVTLYLDTNQLRGPIPPELGNLTTLKGLELQDNQLTEWPTKPDPNDDTKQVIALPASLRTLYLHTNQLRGPIPDLRALTSLVQLYLHTNKLGLDTNGQPIATPDLDTIMPTSLQTLDLNLNQLSGPLPDVSGLDSLLNFYIRNNQLTGPLPDVSGLAALKQFSIHTNKLGTHADGTTVTDISGLAGKLPASTLTHLWLSNNGLSGEIPDLRSLTRLVWLELQDNALTGTLDSLNTFNFQTLYLHNNQLSGAVPAFSGATSHFRLSLYGNAGLYKYHDDLNTKTLLRLLAPDDGTAVCLPTTDGGDDCTVPTLVDNLRVQASPTQLVFSWTPNPAAPTGYAAQYYDPTVRTWIDATVTGTIAAPTATITGLTPETTYSLLVWTTTTETATPPVRHPAQTTPRLYHIVTLPKRRPPPPPPPGGGGGGGTRTPADRHGNTPEDATSLMPRRYTTGVLSRTLTAHLQSRRDVDYFTLTLPYAGVLTATTTGTDTTGRLYQAQEEGAPLLVAEDTDSGRGTNFALGEAVAAGTYYLAVSAGRGSGEYTLRVAYTPAVFGNPAPTSPQSGVSVLSGWVCAADTVEIELVPESGEPQTYVPATGTSRPDTAVACGPNTTDTGYGLLFNWNRLGDGEHTVRVFIDDVLLAERQITVTTLGEHPDQEFRTDLTATTEVADFPDMGETTTLRWETARQNFMIASGDGGGGGEQLTPEQAWLGNPAPGSFQSGIGVLSGWVCDAETVEIAFETATGTTFTEEAGYGTERLDTAGVCGDTDNGFGLLFNWNRLGEGQHTVRASADGEVFGHSTFNVTTLGAHADEEFRRGLRKTHAIADFPAAGQTTTVEWQQGQQNFVITGVK